MFLAHLLAILIQLTTTTETTAQAECEVDAPTNPVESRRAEALRARLQDNAAPFNFSL